jgi:hypothetical protein
VTTFIALPKRSSKRLAISLGALQRTKGGVGNVEVDGVMIGFTYVRAAASDDGDRLW